MRPYPIIIVMSFIFYTLFFMYILTTMNVSPFDVLTPQINPYLSTDMPQSENTECAPLYDYNTIASSTLMYIPYVEVCCAFLNGLFCAAWILYIYNQ